MTCEMHKPEWCSFKYICADFWQAKCIGYPIIYGTCETCIYYKPKERVLNPLIAEFVYQTERLKK